MPSPPTKIHQLHYMALDETDGETKDLLAISTEDGRILFYDTTNVIIEKQIKQPPTEAGIPIATALCQLGGAAEGYTGRVKDFEILKPPDSGSGEFIIVTGSSDGAVRLWSIDASELVAEDPSLSQDLIPKEKRTAASGDDEGQVNGNAPERTTTVRQAGSLLRTYEAGNRITCLKAFIMSSEPESPNDTNGVGNGISITSNASAGYERGNKAKSTNANEKKKETR